MLGAPKQLGSTVKDMRWLTLLLFLLMWRVTYDSRLN